MEPDGLRSDVRVRPRSCYSDTERQFTGPFSVGRMVWLGPLRNIRPFVGWRGRDCQTTQRGLVLRHGAGG